jgi:uncharacterized protein YbjT (DUF2867 family)
MQIVLTGATGYIGRPFRGDFADPAGLASAARAADGVISMATTYDPAIDGYADALALDQQASGRRARELLGWRPHRPDVLEDIERGSYAESKA